MLARGCWKPEERLSPPLQSTSRRPGQLFCHFQHPSMSSGAGAAPAPGSSALWTWHARLSLVGGCSAGTPPQPNLVGRPSRVPRYYVTFRCIIYPFRTTSRAQLLPLCTVMTDSSTQYQNIPRNKAAVSSEATGPRRRRQTATATKAALSCPKPTRSIAGHDTLRRASLNLMSSDQQVI